MKENKGQFKKGHIPWNKGKSVRLNPAGEFKKGHIPWNKKGLVEKRCKYCGKIFFVKPSRAKRAKYCSHECYWKALRRGDYKIGFHGPHSEESRKKMSEAHKGKTLSKEHREKISLALKGRKMGAENPAWKGGISPLRNRRDIRKKEKEWAKKVYERDNYTCQKCGKHGGRLNAHHIYGFYEYPELRFNVNNGITLCPSCHAKFHHKYGKRHNNLEQIQEFLREE